MRGVAHRAGGSRPTFLRKVENPSVTAAPGFARIHRATSPINRGGKFGYGENLEIVAGLQSLQVHID